MVADISQFIDEFTTSISNVHAKCKQSYINGYYNIDLLKLQNNAHYNTFYDSVTAHGFFPKITRPTRSFENSHSLIDNTFVETETISPKSIANFKNSINKANLITQFDLNPHGNPNINYNILTHVLSEPKNIHIPGKVKRFNKRKHFKHKWMTSDLLSLINKKNDRYRDSK